MKTSLVWVTPQAELVIARLARVSSSNPDNPEYEKLLRYLIAHKHWSPFEMASMCVEIETTRMVSAQLLRHRSFSFQEFSQRYAEVVEVDRVPARSQDKKNRQASHDNLCEETKAWWHWKQIELNRDALNAYNEALRQGVAKECARAILPLSTVTRLYMAGSVRSWIHYLQVRLDESTQLEHREVAESIRDIFKTELPTVAKACDL
jgi:thymidylate synthase (FAD)